ncbi:hypothetical protein FHS16_005397 [Paenibacillus endophyticus]|uniref:Uncharacterized protein n=1 Tax=Paenibacillus endophyticus TaxID=1294268 RepID=A0A7W5GCE0_9BACL|nr:hypothetical protein [Paenibacillus endophyticus]MBB3155289.1 hypothetical protein [Paenibacillus endophyticus]
MRPEKLIYTFVSYASHYDTPWGQGTAVEGVDRTAELAHKYGIPVTWIVNGGSVPVLKGRIQEWHDQYGDDVILQCPFFIEDTGMSKEKLKSKLASDWRIVEEAFPWAKTKVAARGKIYNELIEVLEELDFKGMWGYCWEQVWWDGITHKGIPWGSWYVDSSRYKVPHSGKGKIVACEWTARDLNLTYHSGSPCVYSTDPNDVLRAGLCTGEDITYWKNLFDDYLDNTDHNERVYFLQQQEAHEMEFTERFAVFPASHVEACEGMLDLFFAYITQFPITLTTLPKAIELYHEQNEITAPVSMLTRDTLIRPEVNEYTITLGGTGAGPWPTTFLYYDHECQLAFVQGECRPHRLRNYIGKGNMNEEFNEPIPQVFVNEYEKTTDLIHMAFDIGYWNPMPFGLAYWDDLCGYELQSCSDGVQVQLIKERLAFLRFQLPGKPVRIELTLAKRTEGV